MELETYRPNSNYTVTTSNGQKLDFKYYVLKTCPVCGSKEQSCSRVELNDETYAYSCKFVKSDDVHVNSCGTRYWHTRKNYKDFLEVVKLPKVITPSISENITSEVLDLRYSIYSTYEEYIKEFKNRQMGAHIRKLKEMLGAGKTEQNIMESSEELYDLYTLILKKKISIDSLIESPLYPHDLLHLLDRGLNLKQIERMGFFSLIRNEEVLYDGNRMQMKTAIIKRLTARFGVENILRIPGFGKGTDGNGNEFVKFGTKKWDDFKQEYVEKEGFYLPYFDYRTFMSIPKFPAMQERLTKQIYDQKGKPQRYFWFSSSASSGSPIGFYCPTVLDPRKEDIILVTEGDLKMKIACEILHIRGAAMAGVSSYRRLVHDIQELEKLEDRKLKALVCYDADKVEKKEVLESEKNLITLFKKAGTPVTVGAWPINMGKGIDDLLVKGYKPKYIVI